ncbi:hypothetical protein RhiJN_22926 [Ceratobasidium sp. AG-Ba]|nr:hypothetical protein RhiJN_22926 [Ceratobasidium sp. AG-Ba]
MATSFEDFKGKVILHAQATAQEGQVERFQVLGRAIQEYIAAGNEPGCLTFRISRSGNHFLFFEEYANAEAVKVHYESAPFQAFFAEVKAGTLTVGPPTTAFYEEI